MAAVSMLEKDCCRHRVRPARVSVGTRQSRPVCQTMPGGSLLASVSPHDGGFGEGRGRAAGFPAGLRCVAVGCRAGGVSATSARPGRPVIRAIEIVGTRRSESSGHRVRGGVVGLACGVGGARGGRAWRQRVVDFVYRLHSVKSEMVVEPFDAGRAGLLLLLTAALGYAAGAVAGAGVELPGHGERAWQTDVYSPSVGVWRRRRGTPC